MALQKANISWSAKQISSMVKNEKIDFDHIIQRPKVWSKEKKSNLIESMISNYPIPQMFASRKNNSGDNKNNKYFIVDGKQRLSTVKEYLNDEFALTDLPMVTYFDEGLNEEVTLDVNGMKFSELPEGLQDILNTVTFSIVYFDNLTFEEERTLFLKLNNGRPLTAKARSLASSKDIEGLLSIGEHELFNQMLTEKSRQAKNQAIISLKAWVMLNKDVKEVSFASKELNPLIEQTNISDEEKIELAKVFDYILNVHEELIENKEKDVAKKIFTETHMISLVPYIKQAMENSINESMFAEFMVNFFKTENDSDVYTKYMEASNHGIARTANIVARHNALGESYKEFFKMEENSEKVS